jgi:hypothetical protein
MIENYEKCNNNAFNVGLTAANCTKLELAQTIQKYVPDLVIVENNFKQDFDQRNYMVSNEKLESQGWVPTFTLKDGIQELIEGYQLIKKSKEGKLQPEEFQGGSFSISNLGMFGVDQFCAIVNPPQSCILAVSRAIEKPIVENNQIKIASMVNFTISCDHRVIDGAVGAEFLKALRLYIEQPVLNLL